MNKNIVDKLTASEAINEIESLINSLNKVINSDLLKWAIKNDQGSKLSIEPYSTLFYRLIELAEKRLNQLSKSSVLNKKEQEEYEFLLKEITELDSY